MRYYFLICLCLNFLLVACVNGKINNVAHTEEKDGKLFIKLKGERANMVHSPKDILNQSVSPDSFLIEVTQISEGTVLGKNIPVQPGHYTFEGEITIKGKYVFVHLLVNDTDQKKLIPIIWNGKYLLEQTANKKQVAHFDKVSFLGKTSLNFRHLVFLRHKRTFYT